MQRFDFATDAKGFVTFAVIQLEGGERIRIDPNGGIDATGSGDYESWLEWSPDELPMARIFGDIVLPESMRL
jgi:hypothetical protein